MFLDMPWICLTCLAFAQGFLQSVGSDILVGLVGGGRTPSSTNAPSGGGGPVPVLLPRHVDYDDDRLLLLTVRLAPTIFDTFLLLLCKRGKRF